MSKICEICKKGPQFGRTIARRGLPKYIGGIGLKTTGITKRRFVPNLQSARVIIDGTIKKIRLCTKCLKAGKVQKAPRVKKTAKTA